MELKDLTVAAESLDEVRGGTYGPGPGVGQSIFNDLTLGVSIARGGDVGSSTSSESIVTAAHLNTQDATLRNERISQWGALVEGSKKVRIGGGLGGRYFPV